MTRILACGEGAHDVGVTVWDKRTGEKTHLEGWMQPLLKKIMGSEVDVRARTLREIVTLRRPPRLRPMPPGHGEKAVMARLLAANEGFDAVVFMTDADTRVESERRVKVREIEEGFAAVQNDVRCIACVPRSTSESWLLSDVEAWRTMGLKDEASFPSVCPEDLWGTRNDPTANHPKHVFSRNARCAEIDDDRETRRRLSELSELKTLLARCPVSFAEFAGACGGGSGQD